MLDPLPDAELVPGYSLLSMHHTEVTLQVSFGCRAGSGYCSLLCRCPAVGSLEFNAGVRNALGRAERLDVAAEWGSKGSNEYSVALSQPRFKGRPITVEARVAQLFRNFLRHSSFTEQLRQAAVTVSTCAHHRALPTEYCYSRGRVFQAIANTWPWPCNGKT